MSQKIIGQEIYKLAKSLWPLNRSLTGDGVRETLNIIKKLLPNLKIKEVPTGTKVFDWTIPKEWKVNKAYIVDPNGNKICDFSKNNLHLVGYSTPFTGTLSLEELNNHLYSIEDQPDAIPYLTSYYKKKWGFCLTHHQRKGLSKGQYKVIVDTKLFDGSLTYGELIIKGKSKKEVFLSTYICHPSMANNELSGPTVLTYLAKWLQDHKKRGLTYRIIFIPETIGSITYLSINYKWMKKNIIAGFNVTCVGDNRAYSYLPSRDGATMSDNIAKHVLNWTDPNFIRYTWLDRGSDERQYCAPGIDLPIASICRSKYEEYPEYHTSLDTLGEVVTPKGLDGGYWVIRKALELIEKNKKFKVTVLGEPQMGKRGLYPSMSIKNIDDQTFLMMNFISYCDGKTSLLDIADKLNIPVWDLYEIIDKLETHNLITSNI
jgi:aminopeptidase-like protein